MRHFLHTTLTSRAKHDTRGERESSCHLHGQNPYTNLQVESAFKLIPNTAPSMLGPASRLLATNSHATSTCFTKPDQLSVACHTSTTFHDQVYLSLPKISSNSCSHSPPELSRSTGTSEYPEGARLIGDDPTGYGATGKSVSDPADGL